MQSETFNKDGYHVARGLLPIDLIQSLRNDIFKPFAPFVSQPEDDGLFKLFHDDLPTYLACSKVCHQLPSLHKLGLSDAVMGQLNLEFPTINTRPVLLFSSSKLAKHHFYWKAKAHQDSAIMLGGEKSVVVWIPLCDIKEELGYLEVIPGSHIEGQLHHVKEGPSYEIDDFVDESRFRSIEMKQGDVLFFSSALVHRSGINTSDSIRLTVSYRFDDLSDESFVQAKYPIGFEYVMRGQ